MSEFYEGTCLCARVWRGKKPNPQMNCDICNPEDEMDHKAECQPVDTIITDVIVTLRHARIFIASREKMHPTGIQLYDELLETLERRYLTLPNGERT